MSSYKNGKPGLLSKEFLYSSNSNNNSENFLKKQLGKQGLLRSTNRPQNSSRMLGGVIKPIARRKYTLGEPLKKQGQQGEVYYNARNKKKVVKLRRYVKKLVEGPKYEKGNTKNQNNIIKKTFSNAKNVKIDSTTSNLINRYPLFFLEAFLQYIMGTDGISAKVHEIFAAEERNNTSPDTTVYVYIVMDALEDTVSTPNERQKLATQAGRHGAVAQDGGKFFVKENHVMSKNGIQMLIDFGNGVYLFPAGIIERFSPRKFGSIFTVNNQGGLHVRSRSNP